MAKVLEPIIYPTSSSTQISPLNTIPKGYLFDDCHDTDTDTKQKNQFSLSANHFLLLDDCSDSVPEKFKQK